MEAYSPSTSPRPKEYGGPLPGGSPDQKDDDIVDLYYSIGDATYQVRITRKEALKALRDWCNARRSVYAQDDDREESQHYLDHYTQVILDPETRDPVWALDLSSVVCMYVREAGSDPSTLEPVRTKSRA